MDTAFFCRYTLQNGHKNKHYSYTINNLSDRNHIPDYDFIIIIEIDNNFNYIAKFFKSELRAHFFMKRFKFKMSLSVFTAMFAKFKILTENRKKNISSNGSLSANDDGFSKHILW